MSEATGGSPSRAVGRPASAAGFGAAADAADLVVCRLDVVPTEVARLERFLAPDERERVRQFRDDQRRQAFIVGRGRLRELLGLVVDRHPAAVPLVAEPGKKPWLDGPDGRRVRFNIAHSTSLMLCCIMLDRDVGVDVERVDEAVEWEAIAARFFAAAEREALAAIPRNLQRTAFFHCWTRKEAVIKATGEGLGRPLTSFVVSIEPNRAAMLSCDPALGAPENWFLAPVPTVAAYCAAVAVRGGSASVSLRLWAWDHPPGRSTGSASTVARTASGPRRSGRAG